MNKKTAAGFAALSLLVVLAATASVAFRVLQADSAGRKAAKADFERLSAILRPLSDSRELADPALRASLGAYYKARSTLLLATVYERGAGLRWRIPARSPYLPAAENEKPLPETSYPPRSSILLASPLPGDPSGRLVLEALYVTLPQSAVFLAFRDGALGLAAYLVLSALVLLPGAAAASRRRRAGAARSAAQGAYRDDASGDAAEDPSGAAGAPEEAGLGASTEEPAEPFSPLEDEDFQIPDLALDEAPPSAGHEPGVATGLYSPISGLGWESYLADRLDAELARSASFEQDLCLLLVRGEGLAPGMPAYASVAKAVAEFFSFKDLAFERGPEGFAVILPNMDAEHGLRMAEEFRRKLNQAFTGNRDSPDRLSFFMGLSSRAGRLVDSGRVIEESESALANAVADRDSRIVPFRPDPDKYRLYLASKGC